MEKILEKDWKLYLLLTLWSAAAMMLLSPDSPLHGDWNRIDSAWFFMGGKALMNGFRPYVEFSDSKGLLLWLIFGIGYLLSPCSYTGVYVVSCLWYGGIFFYTFKTAKLLLNDDRRSMMVTLLMTFAYFMQWFTFEIRAENYATLFVMISIYYLFRLLYGSDAAQPTVRRCGLVLGGCFMALVMIKWSIAIMQGVMIVTTLWYYARDRKEYTKPVAWMAAGAAMVALPFILYLWMRGAVPAFIEEYFVNTFKTIGTDKDIETRPDNLLEDFMWLQKKMINVVLPLIIAGGGLALSRRLPCYRYVPLLVGLFFYVLATRHNLGYYYTICQPFIFYAVICIVGLFKKPTKNWTLALAAASVIAWGIYLNVHVGCDLQKVALWADNDKRDFYNAISGTMDGSHKPRIMTLCYFENGYGLRHEALPAGKYWTSQFGMTKEMKSEHSKLMESGQADFVILNDETDCALKGWPPGRIIGCGYTRVLRYEYTNKRGDIARAAVYKKQ